MSKRRRAGVGRRIAEQRFWGGSSSTTSQASTPDRAATASDPAPASGPNASNGSTAPSETSAVKRIRPTSDPAAVVRSLGPPPFAIDGSLAERHLTAVYEEAVRAATALAAANGLLAADEDNENS